MTLREVIQGLMRGTDDDGSGLSGTGDGGSSNVEAMLAEHGFGDLPAEMFGQALASYADTAPIDEADALTPILTTLDAGDPSDVYAVLEEQPIALVPHSADPDAAAIDVPIGGLAAAGAAVAHDADDSDDVDDVDDIPDDFGQSISGEDAVDDDGTPSDDTDDDLFDDTDAFDDAAPADETASTEVDEPFADSVDDHLGDAESFIEMFDTGPEATGEDPSDLDLDFDG